jgi:hypothetical protein
VKEVSLTNCDASISLVRFVDVDSHKTIGFEYDSSKV